MKSTTKILTEGLQMLAIKQDLKERFKDFHEQEKISEQMNKVKATREELNLIEEFMSYPEGYLSEWLTWNDVMPMVEKIERTNLDHIKEVQDHMLGKDHTVTFQMGKDRVYTWIGPNWTLVNVFNTDNRLKNTLYCINDFINWYNQQS